MEKTRLFYLTSCFLFSLFSLCLPFPLQALLPPFYESKKELIDILNNDEIAQKITTARVINAIEKTEKGYKITAGECTLEVFMNYKKPPEGFVGPAEYDIKTGNLMCNSEDRD